MRAVVTGGLGFIGSHLVDALLERDWLVCIVDGGGGEHRQRPNLVLRHSDAQRTILPNDPIDAVFHLGGKVGPIGVLRHAGTIAKDTVDAAAAAGAWAVRAGCPLIDVSTSEVYGSPDERNSEQTPRVFQPGHSARMEYAVGKLAAETMLLNTAGLDVRIIRPFNVAGPRQLPGGGFVLPRFVGQALRGEALTVYGDGSQRRAFTHVADIVDGLLLAYEQGEAGEVYNLGNADNECSIAELACDVDQTVNGYRFVPNIRYVDPVLLWGSGFREAPDKIPDATKAYNDLGWRPRLTRAAIIEDVVAYWRVLVAA